MKPLFLSIITINLNNLDGLQKTAKSVFSQQYNNFEYIVIDGCSTDGSVAFLKENQAEFAYWKSEKDTGIYNAMNKGIRASNGKYLLFLNSGDILNGKTALLDFINHENFLGDIIYGDYKFENGEKVYPDTLYPTYFMKTSLPHQSTFFKKSVFDIMGLYDEKYSIGADRAFYIKCYLSGKFQFQHINYFLTLYDLMGLSNDRSYVHKKKQEDTLLLKEQYGDKYQKYKNELDIELKRNAARRNSLSKILKRINNKIKKLWRHH